ncbi:MAG: T9SS type A sorting domain-containing protein [Ferruginibacter sp.]
MISAASVSAQASLSSEPTEKILKFFPNPAISYINFDFNRSYDKGYNLQIFNFMGKKVYDINNAPTQIRVSLQEFYRGIYIYQLRNKNGQIIDSGKFQVLK